MVFDLESAVGNIYEDILLETIIDKKGSIPIRVVPMELFPKDTFVAFPKRLRKEVGIKYRAKVKVCQKNRDGILSTPYLFAYDYSICRVD